MLIFKLGEVFFKPGTLIFKLRTLIFKLIKNARMNAPPAGAFFNFDINKRSKIQRCEVVFRLVPDYGMVREKKGAGQVGSESMAVLKGRAHERLLVRVGSRHRSYLDIKGKMNSIQAGIAGEEKVLNYIRRLESPWPILWDVNLEVTPGQYVQIDVLILLPSSAIIYEAKNMAGRLRFEEHPARLDKVDEQGYIIDRYDCPMLQLNDEIANLQVWFHLHGIPMKAEGAVVMTGSAVIEKPPANGLIFSLREIRGHLAARGKERGMTVRELRQLADYIRRHNRPYIAFPLIGRFSIPAEEVEWGPLCESCAGPLLRKSERVWLCPVCNWKTADPFTRTLEDWFTLRSRTIGNRQVRELFGIRSPGAASRLLQFYPLKKVGDGRSTRYAWDYTTPLTRRLNE